jgi:threonine dehydratase
MLLIAMSNPAQHSAARTPIPAELPPAVRETAATIRPYVRRTPVIDLTDGGLPGRVSLKLESFQHAGSFKTRGAFANLLLRDVPSAGVVAASGGNHGAAVAYAANRLRVPATIFVPNVSSPAKIERIRDCGAQLMVTGASYADALAASQRWSATRDVMSIHAFDQRETILGQGTLGLELEGQAPQAETVLVPVGGGGLLAGLAVWYGRRVRLIGVEPQSAPTLTCALAAGHPVDAEAGGIAADSLAPQRVGEHTFRIIQPTIDRTIVVTDDDIRAAQRHLWNTLRIVAEPGGAAAFAALLSGAYVAREDERIVVVISGGNTTAVDFG